MSNNKQTSVDWLFEKLWETPKDKFTWHSILEQAKEMEKKQIMDAANTLLYPGPGPGDTWAEQYYNKTFKSE